VKKPNPPFLEFGFYFGVTPERDALTQLVKVLLQGGAKFGGTASVHRGKGVRDELFASIHDLELETVSVSNSADMGLLLADPNIRLIQVDMEGASGMTRELIEPVGYQSISSTAAHIDRHPLAVRTEAAPFSGPPSQPAGSGAKEAGKQAYLRFRFLVAELRPAYSAITIEYALECPADLRSDPRSLAFRDFYVSEQFIGADKLRVVENLFEGAFQERIGDGLYVSSSDVFNPMGVGKDAEESAWQSVEVAKLIALSATR
jgi:hypothetical protein